jgi:SOS response regulatory protein OraA/RecX
MKESLRARALRLLARREHTRAELAKKLDAQSFKHPTIVAPLQ